MHGERVDGDEGSWGCFEYEILMYGMQACERANGAVRLVSMYAVH